jgi:uncharacterized protein YqjF (DUF2071 family)
MPYKFLVADWTNLLVATFETKKELLQPYLPAHTELDDWNGKYYISLVAFMFSNTKWCGLNSPFFRRFEEVNLRFYVKHKIGSHWEKGVVFIKEIVPSSLVGLVAKIIYRENFMTASMRHYNSHENGNNRLQYAWKTKEMDNHLTVVTGTQSSLPQPGSFEHFITDRYAGFTKIRNGKTLGFHISHEPWQYFPVIDFDMQLDAAGIYGKQFESTFSNQPASVFLLNGSRTFVTRPVLLKTVQLKTVLAYEK